MGSYDWKDSPHTKDHCDKCNKNVGVDNLCRVSFLYCDKNDTKHPDVSRLAGHPYGTGYRQYKICKDCCIRETIRLRAFRKRRPLIL